MGQVKRFRLPPPGERDFKTLDNLPYGAILLDQAGKILFYNRQEEERAARRREDLLDKDFFEIAPCAQVREFRGQFLEVVREPGFLADFQFYFADPRAPRSVHISMASFTHRDELLCLIVISDITD
jgi:photoactive yellow protein